MTAYERWYDVGERWGFWLRYPTVLAVGFLLGWLLH